MHSNDMITNIIEAFVWFCIHMYLMLVKLIFVCYCTGAASRSFTSTAVNVVTRNERQKVRVERNPTKKGYMRLHTNLGDLNLELHCDLAPRTCENFFILSEGGYYTNTIFHRSIRNFMIQVWVACLSCMKAQEPAALVDQQSHRLIL